MPPSGIVPASSGIDSPPVAGFVLCIAMDNPFLFFKNHQIAHAVRPIPAMDPTAIPAPCPALKGLELDGGVVLVAVES